MVCLQLYDEGDHTPRVLSCGHSVCHSCVADLRSHWGAGTGTASSGLVRCPECKQHTKVPLGGLPALPKNIELMRLVQGTPRPQIAAKPAESETREDPTKPWPLSEFVYGEPVIWVLPCSAITARKEIGGGFSVGEFFCDEKLHSVSLEVLSKIDPNVQPGEYNSRVRLGWDSLHRETRGKLMRLIALSCRCNYFGEVLGLWVSEEGVLFLVSKVWVEGIHQARSLFSAVTDNGESDGEGGAKQDVVGRTSLKTLIRLGLELCEIVMEVHAGGILMGVLGMDSFVLDPYGHLRLLVGSSVFRNNSSVEGHECRSPEVLEIMKKYEDGEEAASASSSCGSVDEAEKGMVTQKADVWSLGCVLLQLLTQQEILEQSGRFKELLLNCMASVPSSRPQVVDLWWELKGLLEDQAGDMPSYLGEDSLVDRLELEICEPERNRSELPAEPETASESRADPQTSAVEATPDAPSLSRALIDVEQCNGEVKTLRGHMDTVSCLSVCGNYLISASFDKTLRVWSLNDYRLVQTFRGHEQRITAVAVNEASELCVSGDYAGHIYAWSIASTENSAPVATWQEHQDWRYSGVASLAISSDDLLYSGSGDRTIKAWSTLEFKHVATMEGHKGVVSVLMVEGQILFSGSWDGTVRLWWRPDHSPLTNFGGGSSVPLGGIRALVKCPANGLLFSGHESGVIQIWNEEECVGTLKAHTGVVSALAFDQDWLYSSSWDGFVKAWPLEDLLSGTSTPVERKCNQAAVIALCCSVQKLFIGTKQEIQVFGHEVVV